MLSGLELPPGCAWPGSPWSAGASAAAGPHPVQRRVGLPVAAAVAVVAGGRAGAGLDRRGAAQQGAGGLRAPPVRVVAGRHQQGTRRLRADPDRASSRGAALLVSRCTSALSVVISASRARQRSARVRTASVAAASGSVSSPGSSRAAVRTSWVADRPRGCSRSSAGAVTRQSSWTPAVPAWDRGGSAACTARTAASASTGSDLPLRRRAARSGRWTTTWRWVRSKRASAAPKQPVPPRRRLDRAQACARPATRRSQPGWLGYWWWPGAGRGVLAAATCRSLWVSTPTVTRAGPECAMVVVAISLR
jgi:hypothetical protein